MFLLIACAMKVLTAVFGWGSFLLAVLLGTVLLDRKRKVLGYGCITYAVCFLILRFFFSELYFQWIPGVLVFLTVVSTIRSCYKDRVNGKRWWNW